MWVFTTQGFYSVVAKRKPNGGVEPSRVIVRARLRRHLENLEKFAGFKVPIQEDAGTDYAFRIEVSASEWQQALVWLAEDITYPNFKDEAQQQVARVGSPYLQALHDVWFLMVKLQRGRR